MPPTVVAVLPVVPVFVAEVVALFTVVACVVVPDAVV